MPDEEFHHPMQTGAPTVGKLDLGDGHWIEWSTYQGAICGGIITHTTTKWERGMCSGCFWIDDRYHKANGTSGPVWQLTGTFECPTLSPSFLCHCGDHGFIREGKWVRA